MRRCMTPNPHVKTKTLSEIVGNCPPKKESNLVIDYDNFIFADRITNHKIVIGDAKNKYGTHNRKNTLHHNTFVGRSEKKLVSSRGKNMSSNRQIEEINQCWNFMKTTKLFQMDSLKSKNFSKNTDGEQEGKENSSYDNMHKKKKNLRAFIENYIHNISIKQFRKYSENFDSNSRKSFNRKVINLWKHIPNKLTRQNIGLIVDEIMSSEEKVEDFRKFKNIPDDQIIFPEEERLERMLMNHALIKHKEFEHLIQPKHDRNTETKYHIQRKPKTAGIHRTQFQFNSQIETLNFNELDNHKIEKLNNEQDSEQKQNHVKVVDLNQVVKEYILKDQAAKQNEKRRQVPNNLKNKQKNLIVAVENGLVYDLLFLLIRWPVLLFSVDSRGNNLLHIAAKKNQPEIYDILLKKMGVNSLKQKNLHGKTPIELAKLFNSQDIIRKNNQYEHTL